MRFSDSFLAEIRDRVAISSLIGQRVTWDRKKTNISRGDYWACCPFHGENTPSFHCEDRKGRYHCFGCGASGDHFRFLTEHDGMSFPEAVERIADMAGVAMPARDPQAEQREREKTSLIDVMEMAAAYFQQQLHGPKGANARAYLRDRGLTSTTQQAFRVGYAPGERNGLKEYLTGKGVRREEIEACGLVVHGPDIAVSYDRFRDRIMFPITDARERVIAFGGRAMAPDAPAKYLNSNDTELFHKGKVLYNLARARKANVKAGSVIAVEGYMDVIALAQAGFANVVAPLGTALTEHQLDILWRMTGEPVLCFDGDQAGMKAAWRVADMALPLISAGRSLRFALLPQGQDPDDLVKAGGPAAFDTVLAEARPLADLIWMRETANGVFDTPERRAALEHTLRQLTQRIRDDAVRHHYAQDMRARVRAFFGSQRQYFGQQASAGRQDYGRGQGRTGEARGRLAVSESLARSALVRTSAQTMPLRETVLLVAMINHPALLDEYFETFEEMQPSHADLRRLYDAVLDALARQVAHEREALVAALNENGVGDIWQRAQQACRNARIWTALEDAALEDAREAFMQAAALHARERELANQRIALQKALAETVESGQEEAASHFLNALNEVSTEIAKLDRLEALVDGFGVMSGRAAS